MMNTNAFARQDTRWLDDAVNNACQRIAPIWPLDKSIAVNPWWSMRDQAMSQVAAKLQYLGNVKMLMDKQYYQSMWGAQINAAHLLDAAKSLGIQTSQNELVDYLQYAQKNIYFQHLGELLDQQLCHVHKVPWGDEIVQQISQFCALYFQYPDRMRYPDDEQDGFYKMWLEVVRQDKGIEILMAESSLNEKFVALPNSINALFELAQKNLGDDVDETSFTEYCHALLLDVNGWASWMANAAWQAKFIDKQNNLIQQLLAIRLAWDVVLWQQQQQKSPESFALIRKTFIGQITTAKIKQSHILAEQQLGWVWQTALELSFQQQLQSKLLQQSALQQPLNESAVPALHAIFCIDVRSEPMRRALESQSTSIKTSGFAGFFGLPIEYAIEGSELVRPQLPGLLKASITAIQADRPVPNKGLLLQQVAAKQSADAAPSTFGVIEAKGILKAASLFKSSFFPSKPKSGVESLMSNDRWTLMSNKQALTDSELASLVAGVLRAMNLTDNFAARILLVGHGSSCTNNPHSAGLDCGACGGQSGEVNVKVLAQVLNSEGVRQALQGHQIYIPQQSKFIACLHNTTTDEVRYFSSDKAFAGETWTQWLVAAKELAQKQRATSVGISALQEASKINKEFERQSNDWAQLRPEWGLANNAAFIVAPRYLSQNLDLQGRSFLHDYDWRKDSNFSTLELIITAPMVVTNWINLQYYACVTDNQKYGSGNKLLHNVVGGNMGVFEGNGGDLRIGLPFQSVHDGKQWRHQPLRLSVYLAAPRQAIAEIISRHKHIADLISNHWLYVFQLDESETAIWQMQGSEWLLINNESACR
jgi:uncharacterized protein YbcC (UPF0753/DUF2309 family)